MLNSKVSRQPGKLQIICQLYKLTRHGFEIEIFDCPSQSLKVILYPHSLSHQAYHSCQRLVRIKLWLSPMLRVWGLQDHLWSSAGVARIIPRLCRRQFVTSTLFAFSEFMHLAYQHIQSGICWSKLNRTRFVTLVSTFCSGSGSHLGAVCHVPSCHLASLIISHWTKL